jgi:hypothetical protein
MEFFNELLTSYALLKRRKFSAKLFEEVAADQNITYGKLKDSPDESAVAAIKATNNEILGVFPSLSDPATNGSDPVPEVNPDKATKVPLIKTGEKTSDDDSPSISNKQQQGSDSNKPAAAPAPSCGGQYNMQGDTIPVVKADCTLHRDGFANWRTLTLRAFYSEGLSQEGGGELSPEMQDLLGGMKDSNVLESIGGGELIKSLGDLYRLSQELGSIEDLQDFDLSSLLIGKGAAASKRTIPRKIINSLLGKEGFTIASEQDMLDGDVVAYTRPAEDYITGSIKNLASVLERIKKFHDNPNSFSIDDLKYIQDHLIISRYRKEGHDRFKVFIKSDQADSLGVSFDWENRVKRGDVVRTRSPLQNLIEDTQNRLNAWGKERGFTEDAVQIKSVDREDAGGGSGNVQKVIEEVSENIDTISTLLIAAQTTGNKFAQKAAITLWSDLLHDYHDRMEKALNLNELVRSGELIGTEQTEVLSTSLQGLQEYLQFRNLSDEVLSIFDARNPEETFNREELKNNVKETFKALMDHIIPLRMKIMKKLAPDFVIRTGNMEDAGKYGRKVDQMLFYRSAKDAKGKGKVKKATLQELVNNGLITESDLDTVRVQYGGKGGKPLDLNTPIHYINQSLKWTRDSKRTNLGNTASIKGVSKEFAGIQDPKMSAEDKQKESAYIETLYDAEGLSPSEQTATTANFNSIHNNMEEMNNIFDGKGQLTQRSATQSARTFLGSIDADSREALGMGQNTIRDLLKVIDSTTDKKEKSTLLNNFKRKVEFRLITNRIKTGSKHKDPAVARSWRAVGASYLMRGCYDTTESDFVVQDYSTGQSYSYDGNKKLTDAMKSFIDTGEGIEFTTRGMSIHGYTANFSMDSSSGRHSMSMSGPVDQTALVKDSLEYSPTELMNKLLEVQELMFTNLIKE